MRHISTFWLGCESLPDVICCIVGVNVGHLEFLPVVLLRLVNKNGSWGSVYNVERYMAGEYVKLSDNLNPVTKLGLVSDLVLAFSHFTYQASNQELIIVDIQGWIPASNQTGCTFLTDPQIHSEIYAFRMSDIF